jgi:hypothetical protein
VAMAFECKRCSFALGYTPLSLRAATVPSATNNTRISSFFMPRPYRLPPTISFWQQRRLE